MIKKGSMTDHPPLMMAWLMWGLVALLYFIGFFQRMAPAVMVDELMRDFAIGGALMGNLSATYFYSYAAMQIPTGLLVDSVGPRKVNTIACMITTLGIVIFAFSPNLWVAYLGRFLIGASVAVAFVTMMKLAAHWFSARRFASVTGIALLVGCIGGVMAGVPLSEGVSLFGWRTVMAFTGVLALILTAASWLIIRDDPEEYGFKSHAYKRDENRNRLSSKRALKLAVTNRQTWFLFFAGGLSTAPVLVFAGLWGVPYLTQIHGLDRSSAALLTSTMQITFAIGGPLLGAISDRMGKRKAPYLTATILTTLCWALFLFIDLPVILFYPVLGLIGLFSGALIIGFAWSREVNHPEAPGAVGGVVNMSVLGFAAILQPLL
ncbi:MAG: MFS transporter, partial [Desulfobulbaceae bacterium]